MFPNPKIAAAILLSAFSSLLPTPAAKADVIADTSILTLAAAVPGDTPQPIEDFGAFPPGNQSLSAIEPGSPFASATADISTAVYTGPTSGGLSTPGLMFGGSENAFLSANVGSASVTVNYMFQLTEPQQYMFSTTGDAYLEVSNDPSDHVATGSGTLAATTYTLVADVSGVATTDTTTTFVLSIAPVAVPEPAVAAPTGLLILAGTLVRRRMVIA